MKNLDLLTLFIVCHLVGDFLLQNHWMQKKSKSTFVCSVHVAVYSIPFWVVWRALHLDWEPIALILLQHWLQDRFDLHRKWMAFYKQSPPELWPVGPLCVDQAFHVSFLAIIAILVKM